MGRAIEKIWIWNHYAIEMYANQGGRHYWFAKNLRARGYSPTVFCANTFHNKDEQIDTGGKCFTERTTEQLPFVFVKTKKAVGNGISRILNMVLFYFNVQRAAKKYAKIHGRPDVILASSVHPLTLVAGNRMAKKWGIPCICEVRDLWPEAIFTYKPAFERSLFGRILTAGEHSIYRKADRLIFTKEGDTDYLYEKGWNKEDGGDIDMRKAFYINNGVDLKAFDKNILTHPFEDEDLSSDKTIVVYTGAIRKLNDVGKLIDVAERLRLHDDIRILVFGDGTDLKVLKKQTEDADLHNIVFKGFVSKQYIPSILSRSHMNLLTYSSTQFNWSRGNSSNKLFEYMASGRPIITNVQMKYSPLKQYQCGLETEENTDSAIAEAILKIEAMPEEEYNRLCQNARAAASEYDFTVLTDKLIQILDTL